MRHSRITVGVVFFRLRPFPCKMIFQIVLRYVVQLPFPSMKTFFKGSDCFSVFFGLFLSFCSSFVLCCVGMLVYLYLFTPFVCTCPVLLCACVFFLCFCVCVSVLCVCSRFAKFLFVL